MSKNNHFAWVLAQTWKLHLLTNWIDGSVQPKIEGPYWRDYSQTAVRVSVGRDDGCAWSYWDGRKWRGFTEDLDDAAESITICAHQHLPWRGLVHYPALFRDHDS